MVSEFTIRPLETVGNDGQYFNDLHAFLRGFIVCSYTESTLCNCTTHIA